MVIVPEPFFLRFWERKTSVPGSFPSYGRKNVSTRLFFPNYEREKHQCEAPFLILWEKNVSAMLSAIDAIGKRQYHSLSSISGREKRQCEALPKMGQDSMSTRLFSPVMWEKNVSARLFPQLWGRKTSVPCSFPSYGEEKRQCHALSCIHGNGKR